MPTEVQQPGSFHLQRFKDILKVFALIGVVLALTSGPILGGVIVTALAVSGFALRRIVKLMEKSS